jgi:hypothetical protein
LTSATRVATYRSGRHVVEYGGVERWRVRWRPLRRLGFRRRRPLKRRRFRREVLRRSIEGTRIGRRPLRLDVVVHVFRGQSCVIGWNVLVTVKLFLLLLLGELDGSEPLVSKRGDEVFVVKVRSEATKDKEIRPGSGSFGRAGVDGFKEIVVYDMKLWADVVGSEVTDKANRACVQRRGAHVLSLTGPGLPLGHFSTVLEPRLQHIDGTAPRMRVHERAEGGLRSGP